MGDVVRVQVLMKPGEADRFERYCQERGYKKSTLIARLVRDHLDREGSGAQAETRIDRPQGAGA